MMIIPRIIFSTKKADNDSQRGGKITQPHAVFSYCDQMNSSLVFHLYVWTGNSVFITFKYIPFFFFFGNSQIKFTKLENENFDPKLGTNDQEGYVVGFFLVNVYLKILY